MTKDFPAYRVSSCKTHRLQSTVWWTVVVLAYSVLIGVYVGLRMYWTTVEVQVGEVVFTVVMRVEEVVFTSLSKRLAIIVCMTVCVTAATAVVDVVRSGSELAVGSGKK